MISHRGKIRCVFVLLIVTIIIRGKVVFILFGYHNHSRFPRGGLHALKILKMKVIKGEKRSAAAENTFFVWMKKGITRGLSCLFGRTIYKVKKKLQIFLSITTAF